MKITYFQRALLEDGSSRAIINIINDQINRGNKIQLMLAFKNSISESLEKKGVDCCYFPYRLSIYINRGSGIKKYIIKSLGFIYTLLINLIGVIYLSIRIKHFNPDLIHTNVGPVQIGFIIARILHIPHIWHIREFQGIKDSAYPLFSLKGYKKKLKKTGVIAISHCIADYFEVEQSSEVIYDGVCSELYIPSKNEKDNSYVFIGRIESSKGIEELLIAFKSIAIKHPDYNLVIIGRCDINSYLDYLKQYIKDNNLNERVQFLGVQNDVYPFISNAKCVVVSSHLEGFGYVAAEAMYNKTLVIGNNNTGTKEQLDSIENSIGSQYVFRYNNTDELITLMDTIANMDIEEYSHIANKVYEDMRNRYSIEQNVEKVNIFYRSVLLKSSCN